MRHPTDGTLRRLLDEPAGVADTDRAHVAGCRRCLAALAAAREDALLVRAALRADLDPAAPADPSTSGVSGLSAASGVNGVSGLSAASGVNGVSGLSAAPAVNGVFAASGAPDALDMTADAGLAVDVGAAWQRLSATMAAAQPDASAQVTAEGATIGAQSYTTFARPNAPEVASAQVTPEVMHICAQSKGTAAGRGTRGEGRWRKALRSPVIAVVGVAAIVTGASAAAAGDWFPIFRAERVVPITVDPADLGKLPELDAYGEVKITTPADVRKVPNAAAAREATGLSVPRVGGLPRGVTGDPGFLVVNQVGAQFTFDAAKAAATTGGGAPAPPAGLDGTEFRMTAGPGLAQVWTEVRGMPALVVVRIVAPRAYSSGVPFETARDYLLSLPSLPPSVAKQLRAFTGDGTSLPMIVRPDESSAAATDVNGVPATLLTNRGNAVNGVVWVEDGVINAVGGSLSADEVLSVARGLA
ncbi:hypothetical protein [Actinoplanes sp. NPDC049265]|uniref:hypothetical protein n=1 Tax=Actinoplanes sp. NPDC049265 TaxID=3363902 RepID=UPI00371FFEDC